MKLAGKLMYELHILIVDEKKESHKLRSRPFKKNLMKSVQVSLKPVVVGSPLGLRLMMHENY